MWRSWSSCLTSTKAWPRRSLWVMLMKHAVARAGGDLDVGGVPVDRLGRLLVAPLARRDDDLAVLAAAVDVQVVVPALDDREDLAVARVARAVDEHPVARARDD